LTGFVHRPDAGSHEPTSWHWSDAVQVTGLLPAQVPDWHVSVCVQALPSLQVLPLAFAGLVHCPDAESQVPTSWHWSDAVQVTGLLPAQLPDWQVSICVQALPSLHVVPLALAGLEHCPVTELQTPTSWHWSDAAQVTGLAPAQIPAWQVSVCVHALPSEQAAPLGFAGFEHCPDSGSHAPASWHWSDATHVIGLVPVQVPDWQLSVWVQALPSLHAVPLTLAGLEHCPVAESQVPGL
jgi:hypothetical protein